ncbi:Iron-containing redox enzyme family protein [Vibrio crassostreae]|nr:Iron-containing redox enzyme family protein [Vibrio crassostreae]CAK3476091.1 Iron-containing redox enzyme family protein [Vibrio crassostreae]
MDKSELVLKTTKELKEIAESGANKIALAMQEATKANYINFVSMLYHYSVPGEAQLNKAALASPTAEMQRLFSMMAEEEADHDIVAMKDMKSMGYKIGIEDELVSSYHKQWDNFTEAKTYEYLGMNVVVENAIHYLAQAVAKMVERLELSEKECTWIRIHCVVDKRHGEAALACAQQHINEHTINSIVNGAREDMERFSNMFVSALRKDTQLSYISK